MSCLCEQGSQPSTASPFKQDVFVYSASPGSESPSMGATATPVIMSRSPTGGWQADWQEAPALPSLLELPEAPGFLECWVGMGSVALGWRSPLPALSRSQGEAAAVLTLAGQGCSGEMAPCAVVLYFHGEFVSFLN